MGLRISACKLLAVLLALPLIGGPASTAHGAHPNRAGIDFGVVASSCSPDRAAAERDSGIQVVTLDVVWDRYEPAEGQFATDYIKDLRQKIRLCRDAGLQVILGIGLQYPPNWVTNGSSGAYVDQYGGMPNPRQANVVFSQAVRDSVAAYLRQVSTDLGFNNFTAIRVGTSNTGELGYPDGVDHAGRPGPSFWAFDQAAQTGDGLAAGMSSTPLPGWTPGTTEWQGQPITAQQVAQWFQWYSRSLTEAISWQVELLRSLGYTGSFHLPVAGRGALPKDLESALSNHLDGRSDPDGALERGLNYPDQFALLAGLDRQVSTGDPRARIIVDFAGLDDNTAVRARKANPPQDSCQRGDTDRLLTRPDTDLWAAQRWTIANAKLAGLPTVGENPGPPDAPSTGGSPDSDNEAQQLTKGVSYAQSCHIGMFLLAFEDDLFNKNSGIGLADYSRQISSP
ncbi:MAG: hypothetical protein ACRDQU_00160 [Pseudonocardiaceae bacterium]